jgi:transposase
MSVTRKRFTREFKLQVVRAFESGVSVGELTRQFDLHANLVYTWTQEYRNNPTGAFHGTASAGEVPQQAEQRVAELERIIGRLTVENDFLKKALQHAKSILTETKGKPIKP